MTEQIMSLNLMSEIATSTKSLTTITKKFEERLIESPRLSHLVENLPSIRRYAQADFETTNGDGNGRYVVCTIKDDFKEAEVLCYQACGPRTKKQIREIFEKAENDKGPFKPRKIFDNYFQRHTIT